LKPQPRWTRDPALENKKKKESGAHGSKTGYCTEDHGKRRGGKRKSPRAAGGRQSTAGGGAVERKPTYRGKEFARGFHGNIRAHAMVPSGDCQRNQPGARSKQRTGVP